MCPGKQASPISFRTLPNKGCPGSVTVIWPSHTSVTRGVLRWLGFAGARLAQQAAVVALLDPVAAGQFQDLRFRKRRHGCEIVGVEVLVHGEAGLLDACPQGVARARG